MNSADRNLIENKKLINDFTESLIKKFSLDIPLFRESITKSLPLDAINEYSYHFLNAPLLLRLALLDLCVLFRHFANSESVVERNLFARLICGQLYEFTEDVPEIFGKKYKKLLSVLPDSESNIDNLKSIIRIFIERRDKYRTRLKEIRHSISHHKDIDGVLQVQLIENLDYKFVTEAYIDLTEWFTIYFEKLEMKLFEAARNDHNDYVG